ncbi:accessory factor UbiK family protein [Thiobacillus sp.]
MNPNPKFPTPPFFDDLVNKLGDALKQSPAKDIEQNLKAGVTSMLGKLDMVSREEFDVQTEVLARTREKLAQLDTRLAALEKQRAE